MFLVHADIDGMEPYTLQFPCGIEKDGEKIYDESYETFVKKAKEDGVELEDAFFAFYDRSGS